MEKANSTVVTESVDDWVDRKVLQTIYTVILTILIVICNGLLGCILDLDVVWNTCKRPIDPLIGMLCQFLVMPLLAYSIATWLLSSVEDAPFALGLLVMGCAPGGVASNFWTILFDGNAHLSVTMTFMSTVAALGTIPFWMSILSPRFLQNIQMDGASIQVPYGRILLSLVMFVSPVIIGIAVARIRPLSIVHAKQILRPFVIFTLTFILTFGAMVDRYIVVHATLRTFLASMLLPLCGFSFGFLAALLCRREPANISTVAIETGCQNAPISIMLLRVSFAGELGTASCLMPILVTCCTPIPLLASYVLIRAREKFVAHRADTKISSV